MKKDVLDIFSGLSYPVGQDIVLTAIIESVIEKKRESPDHEASDWLFS
jgi:hypothetical protein